MDTPPPVLPPGCSLRGRTLHLDLDPARPGAGERPDSRVGAVVLALDAARHYGLSVTWAATPDLARRPGRPRGAGLRERADSPPTSHHPGALTMPDEPDPDALYTEARALARCANRLPPAEMAAAPRSS
jgi:hypothetical protein